MFHFFEARRGLAIAMGNGLNGYTSHIPLGAPSISTGSRPADAP
jgi:hypothetical protein